MAIMAGVAAAGGITGIVLDIATATTIVIAMAAKIKAASDAGEDTITADEEIALLEKARMATSAAIIAEADKDMGKG
jgi:GTP cyclohydrolase II